MDLEPELSERTKKFEASAPADVVELPNATIANLVATFPLHRIPKPGQLAPAFSLLGVTGKPVSLIGADHIHRL